MGHTQQDHPWHIPSPPVSSRTKRLPSERTAVRRISEGRWGITAGPLKLPPLTLLPLKLPLLPHAKVRQALALNLSAWLHWEADTAQMGSATGVPGDAWPTSVPMSSMDAACRACFCSIKDGGAARAENRVGRGELEGCVPGLQETDSCGQDAEGSLAHAAASCTSYSGI